jgi:Ni,Fe-hydrogenase III small subunit/formate hydrogenlyase subunit 6/NADH:ubiquinone oxidoreductase subunit I
MFEILRKSLATGIVTTKFPDKPLNREAAFGRGRPEIDFKNWKDAGPATAACPTAALACSDSGGLREATLDLGKCTFCGLCAEADESIRMTTESELATTRREDLITRASYHLASDGTQSEPISVPLERPTRTIARNYPLLENVFPSPLLKGESRGEGSSSAPGSQVTTDAIEALGKELKSRIHKRLGRSLHIREVDAGSCNGCEIEIVGLNSPVYDIERFGIHFVASPRHADMLLVTGPVSRNMELALRKTYDATPAPRVVVAAGACGCSGGIFGQNYATVGGVDKVIPVDVYIPGCPPNPYALLQGILLAVGRCKTS